MSAPQNLNNSNLDKFDHVVVLMLENRSFDNLFGYLYQPGQVPRGQKFEGVDGEDLSNPIPPYADQAERELVPVHISDVMDNPNPDPGEEFPHINTQLFGTVIPESNRYKNALDTAPPYNTPEDRTTPATMKGFLTDYIDNFLLVEGRMPTYDEYKVIMSCYSPESVPVVSTLARQFAICDNWHCEVPSQTFCNRSFFHAATSTNSVLNAPYGHWVSENNAETIFDRIESAKDKGLSWRVYFDSSNGFSLTSLLHYPRLQQYFRTHFFPMEQFYKDVSDGNLPSYAFIEPRLYVNHNDMHPPIRILGITQHSSVLAGELLVSQIYDAIRQSKSPNGSNYRNTLFVLTFDEHGGCYDHVPPPSAIPPDPSAQAGQMGFRFDRLGVRVPAVLVSAYIEPGTVINTPLQHTSIIKTISEKWGLGHLTERDKAANDIGDAFNRATPRETEDWPLVAPRTPPELSVSNLDYSLNHLQKDVLGLAVAIGGDPRGSLSDIKTVFDAVRYMKERAPLLQH